MSLFYGEAIRFLTVGSQGKYQGWCLQPAVQIQILGGWAEERELPSSR